MAAHRPPKGTRENICNISRMPVLCFRTLVYLQNGNKLAVVFQIFCVFAAGSLFSVILDPPFSLPDRPLE